MLHHDLIPSLLFKLNENQLAIAAAAEELSNWVELGMLRSTCCAAAASRNLHGTQRYLLKTT